VLFLALYSYDLRHSCTAISLQAHKGYELVADVADVADVGSIACLSWSVHELWFVAAITTRRQRRLLRGHPVH
jgi:hypothetical protein